MSSNNSITNGPLIRRIQQVVYVSVAQHKLQTVYNLRMFIVYGIAIDNPY